MAVAALIGTSIEWYDFFIYGIAAALVYGTQFFPSQSPAAGTLAALSTFAVGFLARPVGAVIMGHFGDRIGRRAMLMVSLLVMGAATLIGLLPTYAQIGVAAPILLVVLRLAQGLAVGGEWGGAVLISVEHAPENRRGWYGSFTQMGVPVGLLASNLVFLLASMSTTAEQFAAWGWRVPFLLSAVLVMVGLYVRLRLAEDERSAALRAAADLGDRAAAALAEELSITAGTEFGRRFAASAVLPAWTGVERWEHPGAGALCLAYESLPLPGTEEHRLVVHLPADAHTSDALDGLAAQQLAST